MATYTERDRQRHITAIWQLIGDLEAEYLRKREEYGSGFGQQDEARRLINRIDRLKREVAKL